MPRRQPKVVSRVQHFAAPTGGLNSYDNVAMMPPTDAVMLDNLFPETTYIRLRRGSTPLFQDLNNTFSGPVRSLMTYSGSQTGDVLYGAGMLTGGGAMIVRFGPGQPAGQGGFQGDQWQSVNFATPGGQWIVAVNGVDNAPSPIWTNNGGTNWTSQPITWGPSGSPAPASNFSSIASFNQRLFFAGDQNLYLYWLPVTVFAGEVHGQDLGQYFTRGGNIVSISTWTRDNSFDGMTDMLVVATNKGEVITFTGVDPDDPSNWYMAGHFYCGGLPIGHRQMVRMGPDMMMICQDGFQSLANYLAFGQSKALTTAISRKIGNAVSQALKTAGTLFGWDCIFYPANNALIVNVPQPAAQPVQYVVNTITGAWCRFLGLNAYCWALYAGGIYFGTQGAVMQADTGTTDAVGNTGTTAPISYEMVSSFQMLGQIPNQKRATMARPFLVTTGPLAPAMDVNTDYTVDPVTSPIAEPVSGANWNEVNWNQFEWSSEPQVTRNWFSVDGIGTAFALHLTGVTSAEVLQLLAYDIAYEPAIGVV